MISKNYWENGREKSFVSTKCIDKLEAELRCCGTLRGGHGLLEGLTKLLQGVPEAEPDEQVLYEELKKLVQRKPTNFLQELKFLVTKHAVQQCPPKRNVASATANQSWTKQLNPVYASEWKQVARRQPRHAHISSDRAGWNFRSQME